MPHQPRYLSTAAKVHPSYLAQMHLQHNRRVPTRWFASIATLMAAGYGLQSYLAHAHDTRIAQLQAAEAIEAERRRQNEALMDEYGDRSSLEELEKAVQFYERKS